MQFLKKYSILLLMLFILSCNKDDDDVVGGQAILTNDTSETTGELEVTVIDANGNPVNGVEVTLHATLEDLEKNIWIYRVFNNSNGVSDFGFINIGNYYIYANQASSNRNNNPGDVAQVRSQKLTERTVVIK